MKITVLAVGRIKERFFREAVDEYAKRLSRYCRLEIREAADEPCPEQCGTALEEQIKAAEGGRLLKMLRPDTYAVALAIEGDKLDSPGLAGRIEKLGIRGRSDITFLIGGSLGLSDEVLERADEKLSFSDMTFPHQLMRVILLEQIYRAFRIQKGEPYHK